MPAVYIIGVGMTRLGKHLDQSVKQLSAQAISEARPAVHWRALSVRFNDVGLPHAFYASASFSRSAAIASTTICASFTAPLKRPSPPARTAPIALINVVDWLRIYHP